jgi:sec-independent protein translocase protein TatA
MFGFGHWELLIILVIALLIFGAGKLPQVGSALGKSIGNFKKGFAEDEKIEKKTTKKIDAYPVD